ncbi:MAG: NAD(P)H-binding protein [Chromatiales bacterium]|nr:NAD(P)H-binding protein [Chromatiales bacterium]
MSDSAATTLVIGAATDPGLRLVQLLVRDGQPVVGVNWPGLQSSTLGRLDIPLERIDLLERAEVDALLARYPGPLAVVCFIGGSPQLNSQGNLNLIHAAAGAGVTRFILTTSIGCGDSSDSVDPFVKAFIGKALKAKNWAERALRATELPWTIIRSGGLTLRPGRGGPMLVDSPHVIGYINRTDLGDVVFQALQSPRCIHRVLAAVDSGKAFHVKGEPLVPAEL